MRKDGRTNAIHGADAEPRRSNCVREAQPSPAAAAVGRPVPSDTGALMRALFTARRKVIADGRCSMGSVLLALGLIPRNHINEAGRRIIDDARRAVGASMHSLWAGEEEWIQQLPVEPRIPNAKLKKVPYW